MNTKRRLSMTIALIAVLTMLITVPAVLASGQAGTTLDASVTATAHWTRTFAWTIDKSVTPDTWEFYPGNSGTSQYTITVTKDEGTDAYYIEGVVSVTNGGEVATENLAITIELRDGVPPPNDLVATATVDVSGNPVLDPGETGSYPYEITIPTPIGTGTYKITAVVNITNHSGHLGEPFGPRPSATTTLPSSPTLINDKIHVDDDNVENPVNQDWDWEFSANGFVTYDKTFTCDDAGENTNTATILETGKFDSATVTVNCLAAPESAISGIKFYDTDVDGEYDAGGSEPGLEGWTISLYKLNTSVEPNVWVLVTAQTTGAAGDYLFTVEEAGRYKITETLPTPPPTWVQTCPAGGYYEFDVELGTDYSGKDFGNVQIGCLGGGKTIGYWSNNNGKATMNDTGTMEPELAMLAGLNLVKKDGTAFDPTTYDAFKSWLLNAEATNMAYMLSAQLAAMALNVEAGFVGGNAMVYAPCVEEANAAGFISINDLMDAANNALGADGYTPAGDPNRATQECIKNALDKANNNKNFVCPPP